MADGELAALLRAAGPCPSCGAGQVRIIMYGLPYGPSDDIRIEFGGCCVDFPTPQFRCGACGEAWSGQNSPPAPDAGPRR